MSHIASGWAIQQKTGSPTRKLVLLILSDFHNWETGRCDPSISTIAKVCECGTATVSRALLELEKGGYLTRQTRQRADGSLTSTQYTLMVPTLTVVQPLVQSDKGGLHQSDKETRNPLNQEMNLGGSAPPELSVEDVAGLYNELTPKTMPGVEVINESRKRRVSALLKKHPDEAFWRGLFERAGASKFLRGEKNGHSHSDWVADFDYLIRDSVIYRVIEGSFK